MQNRFNDIKAICEEYCDKFDYDKKQSTITVTLNKKYFAELFNRLQNLNAQCFSLADSDTDFLIATFIYFDDLNILNDEDIQRRLDILLDEENEDWWKNQD
jgi:hypothetical protein